MLWQQLLLLLLLRASCCLPRLLLLLLLMEPSIDRLIDWCGILLYYSLSVNSSSVRKESDPQAAVRNNSMVLVDKPHHRLCNNSKLSVK